MDPNLLDESAPGPTIDPNQLDPNAPGPTLDPGQLDQGIAEPSGVADGGPLDASPSTQDFHDPSLAEPAHTQPDAPGQDFDDPTT